MEEEEEREVGERSRGAALRPLMEVGMEEGTVAPSDEPRIGRMSKAEGAIETKSSRNQPVRSGRDLRKRPSVHVSPSERAAVLRGRRVGIP